MTNHKRIALPDDPDTALLKGVAMDIGKEIVAYVERMHPNAINATSGGFPLSLRNSIYNEIVAAMKVTDPVEIQSRLDRRRKQRRELKAAYRNLRETDWEHARQQASDGADIIHIITPASDPRDDE